MSEAMEQQDLIAYKIATSLTHRNAPYDTPIIMDSQEIGSLCLLSGLELEISALTDYQLAALNAETTEEIKEISDIYTFKNNYVVISSEWKDEYQKYKSNSSFWGEYCHIEELPSDTTIAPTPLSEITIEKSITARTTRHKDSLSKFATYSRPTDKFLFLYHCLEIDFDHEVVKKIRSLDDENPSELGIFLRNLKLDDIDRLHQLIENIPAQRLEAHILKLRNHADTAKKIFYKYGKDSNPIKEESDFERYFITSAAISETEFIRLKSDKQNPTKLDPTKDYGKKLAKFSCYWIYRVRCCIAHNKLGEYHLHTQDDLNFIQDFAIPILKEIIKYRIS